jgi:HD-like signal output (HDOD) protein
MGRRILRAEVGERNAAVTCHCRRVAALAVEIGRRAGIPSTLEPVLQQAAQFHHSLDLIIDPTPLGRLAWDVLCADRLDAAPSPPPIVGPELQTVLAIFHRRPVSDAPPKLRTLAGILTICNLVDERIEALQFEYRGIDTILDDIQSFAVLEGFDPALVDHFRRMRCSSPQQIEDSDRLPVEARTAQRVYRYLWQEREYDVQELEVLAARDAVLAGSLIGVANSALYNPAGKLGSVGQAVSYIGTVATRKVLLASALRPLFASAGLNRLWSHSVASAQYCSELAAQTAFSTPDEGLLLGLLHDIGALAQEFFDHETRSCRARLVERGCPDTYAECLLLGADHGEIGARTLTRWGFPEHLVEAVRFHHQPERSESALAALLYLAEFWAGLDEDLPSFYRVEHCLARTGLSLESLTQVGSRDSALKALRSVA